MNGVKFIFDGKILAHQGRYLVPLTDLDIIIDASYAPNISGIPGLSTPSSLPQVTGGTGVEKQKAQIKSSGILQFTGVVNCGCLRVLQRSL